MIIYNKKVKDDFLMKLIKNSKNFNYLLAFIMCFFSYIALTNNLITSYNILSWILIVVLLLAFKYCLANFTKSYKLSVIIFSMAFSLIVTVGGIVYGNLYSENTSFLTIFISYTSLCDLIGYFNIFLLCLNYFIPKVINYNIEMKKILKHSPIFIFAISFCIIVCCWSIYLLKYYPCNISPDSLAEIKMILNNFSTVSDHHPIIHILFIALPLTVGLHFFNNINTALFLYSLLQVIIMASIFSYLISFLYKRKVPNFVLIAILAYFALVPMHGFYSIVMWKDVLFAGLLLLLTINLYKILEKDEIDIFTKTSFIVVSLLTIFFRNNAVYMYFLVAITSFFFFKKHYKYFIFAFCIVFGVYGLVKGPVFSYFNVVKSSSAEYIGMPLQQIGRMVYKNVELTTEETKLINNLLSVDEMKKSYNPLVSDGIKFNKNFNIKAFDNNKFKYLNLWLHLVIKHPVVAVEAYLTSTLGYWYPNVEYWTVSKGIYDNDLGIYNQPKIDTNIPEKLEDRKTPFINMTWSIGLCFWIIALFSFIAVKKAKDIKAIYLYVPVIGIWLTMMIASPVFAEFRYVYGAFTCLPLLIIFPYLLCNSKGEINACKN